MLVRVNRPTHILAAEGLHEVDDAEARRLFKLRAAEEYVPPKKAAPKKKPKKAEEDE